MMWFPLDTILKLALNIGLIIAGMIIVLGAVLWSVFHKHIKQYFEKNEL